MKAPLLKEADLQHQVAEFLEWGLGGNAVGFHIRNEQPGEGQRIVASKAGILPGCPDVLVVDAGRAIFIELKRPGFREKKLRTGKFNEHEHRQLAVHNWLRMAGCPVLICESLEEVIGALRYLGVPMRTQEPGIPPDQAGMMIPLLAGDALQPRAAREGSDRVEQGGPAR